MLVVVDTDASLQRAVVRVAEAAGLDVVVCATARAAWNACGALAPDCFVVAVSPTDHEGFWLLAALRARRDEVATTALIALAAREPGAHAASMTRVQALEAGADVVLQKPIETSELIAQVKALTKMAARVRSRRDVLFDPDGLGVVAGDLDLEPVSEVLRALEAKRWSGALHLTDRGFVARLLVLELRSGALIEGHVDDRALTATEALREALAWSGRRFELFTSASSADVEGHASLAELLQSVLSQPGAGPLGVRVDHDLPEISARPAKVRSRLDVALAPSPTTPTAPESQRRAPGRGLVESVTQSARPDPRAESDT